MRWKYWLLIFILSIPISLAHSGLYHNYAGSGTGFLILLFILILCLYLYEKFGDTPLGRSILYIGILIPLYVDLFFPQEDHFTSQMQNGIFVIIVIAIFYNFLMRGSK